MAQNFSKQLTYDGKTVLAIILPALKNNGMHYEVNIKGYPRFYMKWSELGRFDVVPGSHPKLPYPLILAVSDAIEEETRRN